MAEPKCLLDTALANFANSNNQLIDEETEEHTFTELINKTSSNTPEDDVGGRSRTNDSGSSDPNYSSSTSSSSPENSCAVAPVSVKKDTEVIDCGKREETLSKPATSAGTDLTCADDKGNIKMVDILLVCFHFDIKEKYFRLSTICHWILFIQHYRNYR